MINKYEMYEKFFVDSSKRKGSFIQNKIPEFNPMP